MESHDLTDFARRHDPDRFFCALFAPAAARPALFALIALNHELARAREVTTSPIAALIRLQWWRDAIEEAAAGKPARRHEVAAPLHAAIMAGALAPRDLLGLVDAREIEAEEEGIPTRESFGAYLRAGAGGLALAMASVLRVPEDAWPAVQRRGAFQGLAGCLRNLHAHAAQGRCLLPRDALAEAGLSAEAVIAEPDRAAPLCAALAEEGAQALAAEAPLPREALPLGLGFRLAQRDLRRIAAGRPVASPRGLADKAALAWAGLFGRA